MNEEQLLFLLLMEEAAEVQQICSKIIRFGASDFHPKNHNIPNIQLLKGELNDLYTVIDLIQATYDVDLGRDEKLISEKSTKIEKYKNYSKNLGRVV